jgi:hypothetical protein
MVEKLSQAQNQSSASYLFHADFLLGLLFDREVEGIMLLRNVGRLSTD